MAMRVWSVNARGLLNDYANNAFKIESDASEKILTLQNQKLMDVADITAEITKSNAQKNKDIISIMSDSNKQKFQITQAAKDEVWKTAQYNLDKMKYDHAVTMDAANLAINQANLGLNQNSKYLEAVDTISKMTISNEQKDQLLKQMQTLYGQGSITGGSDSSNVTNLGSGEKNAANCVLYARESVPNLPYGLFTVQDKMNAVNVAGSRDLSKIQVGDAILTSEGDYGHAAVVTGVNGDKITVREANYKAGQITSGRVLDKSNPKILGFVSSKNGPQMNSQVSENFNEGQNPAIEEDTGFFSQDGGTEGTDSGIEIDPTSQSIMEQTGLGMNAFYWVTGQGTKLSRDAKTRTAAALEAQNWANEKGVDISTLASQYDAINKVLASNISRMNKSKIMEQEIVGTIDNLQGVVNDTDLSRLNVANVAKIWAGQEVNDPLAQQYAMHLYQLRQELAGYANALSGGTSEITVNDEKNAELVIRNGLSTGSLQGLKTAVENSTSKMGKVLQGSVDAAHQQVWDLFGVGENYQPTYQQSAQTQNVNVISPDGTPGTIPADQLQEALKLGYKQQ